MDALKVHKSISMGNIKGANILNVQSLFLISWFVLNLDAAVDSQTLIELLSSPFRDVVIIQVQQMALL